MDSPKTITVKASEIYESIQALRNLMSEKHKAALAHRMAISLRAIKTEQETLEETRESLVDKYAARDDDDRKILHTLTEQGVPIWKFDDQEAFQKEWQETLKGEIQIVVYPVDVKEFGKRFEIAAMDLEVVLRMGILIIDEDSNEDDD